MVSSPSRCRPRPRTVVTGCITSAPSFIVISDCDRLFSAADEPKHIKLSFCGIEKQPSGATPVSEIVDALLEPCGNDVGMI